MLSDFELIDELIFPKLNVLVCKMEMIPSTEST